MTKLPCRITVAPKTPATAAAKGRWRKSRGSTAGRSRRSSTTTNSASSGTTASAATRPSLEPSTPAPDRDEERHDRDAEQDEAGHVDRVRGAPIRRRVVTASPA